MPVNELQWKLRLQDWPPNVKENRKSVFIIFRKPSEQYMSTRTSKIYFVLNMDKPAFLTLGIVVDFPSSAPLPLVTAFIKPS